MRSTTHAMPRWRTLVVALLAVLATFATAVVNAAPAEASDENSSGFGVQYNHNEWRYGDAANGYRARDLYTCTSNVAGDDVRMVQVFLYRWGYYGAAGWPNSSYQIDGVAGSATCAAVKEFQRDHSLTVDGIVGGQTWYGFQAHGTSNSCIWGTVGSGAYCYYSGSHHPSTSNVTMRRLDSAYRAKHWWVYDYNRGTYCPVMAHHEC